jgi:hypothetical protein
LSDLAPNPRHYYHSNPGRFRRQKITKKNPPFQKRSYSRAPRDSYRVISVQYDFPGGQRHIPNPQPQSYSFAAVGGPRATIAPSTPFKSLSNSSLSLEFWRNIDSIFEKSLISLYATFIKFWNKRLISRDTTTHFLGTSAVIDFALDYLPDYSLNSEVTRIVE